MARVMGEPIPGINAICAPVFEHTGAIRLGITAIGPAGNFDAGWQGEIAHKVLACAQEISRRLGYEA
jgi:DNA-binding IclR family transcriptional regulator